MGKNDRKWRKRWLWECSQSRGKWERWRERHGGQKKGKAVAVVKAERGRVWSRADKASGSVIHLFQGQSLASWGKGQGSKVRQPSAPSALWSACLQVHTRGGIISEIKEAALFGTDQPPSTQRQILIPHKIDNRGHVSKILHSKCNFHRKEFLTFTFVFCFLLDLFDTFLSRLNRCTVQPHSRILHGARGAR